MANKVGVGKGNGKAGGYLYCAPLGTALPTDATTALAAAYKPVALISEDGLTNSVSETSNDYRDWAGDTVMSGNSARTETMGFSLIETSMDAMKMVFGDAAVSGTEDKFTVDHTSAERPAKVYVFEVLMSDTQVKRIVCPSGKVTALADVSYAPGSLITYPLTMTCQKADGVGYTVREFVETVDAGESGSGDGDGE